MARKPHIILWCCKVINFEYGNVHMNGTKLDVSFNVEAMTALSAAAINHGAHALSQSLDSKK